MEDITYSQNSGYAVEELGLDASKDGMVNWAGLAFGALYADVSEAYGNLEEPEGPTE